MVVGVLYLTWQPDYGSKTKTETVLATSKEKPQPLTLDQVTGTQLLLILQKREVLLGRHVISLKLDGENRARLIVSDGSGCRQEFHLANEGSLSTMVNQAVAKPDECGFGFVIKKDGDRHVLHASALGFEAKVDTNDIDNGLGEVLADQRKLAAATATNTAAAAATNTGAAAVAAPPKSSSFSVPFRAKSPFQEEHRGTETIKLQPVQPPPSTNVAQQQ